MGIRGLPVRACGWLVATIAILLAVHGCTPGPKHDPDEPPKVEKRKIRSRFAVKRADSVAYRMFNVTVPGTIRVRVEWDDRDSKLDVALIGKSADRARRTARSGTSPIELVRKVTAKDVERGVAWRVVVSGAPRALAGSMILQIPFERLRDRLFRRERIDLRSGSLWPNSVLQTKFETDLAVTTKPQLHAIITLKRAATCVELFRLRALGVVQQSHLPGRHAYGYVRKGTDFNDPLIKALVKRVTPLDPEDKVDPPIWLGDYARFTVEAEPGIPVNYVRNEDGSLELSVLFAKDVSRDRMAAILAAEAVSSSAITDTLRRATVLPVKVAALAAYDEVEWIDPGPVPHLPTNNRTRQNLNVNAIQNATINAGANTITYAGRTGAGVTVGVDDSGVDANHPDLNVVADLAGMNDHGTHVAGIIAASGVQSALNDFNGNANNGTAFQWRGMAPNAAIIDSGNLINAANLLDAIQTNSLDLANHSHTLGVDGNYDANNQTVDQEIRGGTTSGGTTLPRRPQVYGAANNGVTNQYGNVTEYFSLLNQSKNAIVVGAWDVGANDLAAFSSLGPAHDGRAKPDVVAPGSGVISTGTADNERQVIEMLPAGAAPTTGTFTLNFNGQVTAAIPFNASATTVRTSLESLNNINVGDVTTGGGPLPGSAVSVVFGGQFTFTNVAQLVTVDTGIDNGAATNVRTPQGGHDDRNGYDTMGGTSMASPATAGVVALLLEGWQATYGGPLGTTLDNNPPLPSTLRAVLVQTAVDIVNNDVRNRVSPDIDLDSNPANGNDGQGRVTATAGPDFATGWGRVDAQAAQALLEDSRTVNGNPRPKRIIQDAVSQGVIKEYDFVVDQAGPLRVTLAWDDVEAAVQSPGTSKRLINDLDLELVDPNGAISYPWQLGQTIQDTAGNVLANNAQPPGTNIQVVIPITPMANPAQNEYVPANALTGNGAWVAGTGKDHLNNVEQVFVANVPANLVGHWKLRVLGFDIPTGTQDYSVVGFPYPDLAELEVSVTNKVTLPGLNTPIAFTSTFTNTGPVGTGASFNYQVWLSRDFVLDGSDVALTDTNQSLIGALGPGGSVAQNSSVQITQANADALMGAGTTIQDLQDADVFLIIQGDSGDTVLEHNETNTAVVQLARPVDVVLVMDSSGSMSGNVPVSNGTQTKMQILQDSAKLFLDLLRQDGGDEVAEVSFSSPGAINTIYGPSGLTAYTSAAVVPAKAAIDGLSPLTSTDIRGGLQRGLDLLKTGGAGRRRVLIFFSDGEKTAGGDPTEAVFLQQFANEDIHIYSVGFGTEGGTGYSGIDTTLLQTLTNANAGEPGFFHVTASAVALDKFFVNAVAGAIDAQVVVDPEGDIGPGQTRTVPVSLGAQDFEATFVLAWDNPASNLNLSVRTPKGLTITASNAGAFGGRVTTRSAPAYRLMKVRFPISWGPNTEHGGKWQLVLTNPGSNTVHYAASVMSESTIRAAAVPPGALTGTLFRPGDPIPLLAKLQQLGGQPLHGATVTVTANVPTTSIGKLLTFANLSRADIAAIPKVIGGDKLSQLQRAHVAIQRNLGLKELLPRTHLAPIKLGEIQEQGHYAGIFESTRLEGVYEFLVRIDGVTPDCALYQRELNFSVLVEPDPDPRGTVITTDWGEPTAPAGGVTVSVTPGVTAGHRMGPGYGSRIRISGGDGMKPASDVVDHGDGSYSQAFRVDRKAPARVRVRVVGVDMPVVNLDTTLPEPSTVQPPKGPGGATIAITFGADVDLRFLRGLALSDGRRAIRLSNIRLDDDKRTIRATVPRGIKPGRYAVRVLGARGRSPDAKGATFEIVRGE
ncbi:MAG: S8 family serine peptidase [Planctomycetota bacterium]|jgi:subtilisin family serine protease